MILTPDSPGIRRSNKKLIIAALLQKALLALVFVFLSCSGAATRLDADAKLHLVIDAGSSGTRFCLYRMETSSTGACAARDLPRPYHRCMKIRSPNGLADLPLKEAVDVLERGFARIEPSVRGRIVSFALLGTGGFRAQSKSLREARMAALTRHFAGHTPSGRFQVITGAMEGKLAWRTTRLLFGPDEFSILETGGATVQFAVGRTPRDVRAISAPTGLNLSRARLEKKADFKHCAPGKNKTSTAFDKCRTLILRSVMQTSTLARGIRVNPPAGKLFALGAPWTALFRMTGGKTSLTTGDIQNVGREFCALSLEQTVGRGIPRKYAVNTCYMIAHESALLALTGRNQVHRGGESWPRGAAVTPEFFPGCVD